MGRCQEEDLAEKDLTLAIQREGGPGGSGTLFRVDEERANRSRWDKSSRLTIKGTTKPCPQCRTPTERSGKRVIQDERTIIVVYIYIWRFFNDLQVDVCICNVAVATWNGVGFVKLPGQGIVKELTGSVNIDPK